MKKSEFAELLTSDRERAIRILVEECFDTLGRSDLMDWVLKYHLGTDPNNYRAFSAMTDDELKSVGDGTMSWDAEEVKFRVEALEMFAVRTVYENVMATDKEAAIKRCQNGVEAYDSHTIAEGNEAWLETVSVTPVEGDSSA
jgi:hypothetical protein